MAEKRKLLLIEDEGYVIERTREIVSSLPGFELELAGDVKEAKEKLETGAFDTVITDIYLRGASGLELLHRALKARPGAAVVIITSAKSVELAEKALREGAMDFVIKPPGLERLSSILKLISMLKP